MSRNQLAFTLIEISIALIVIGLVLGGILVGRDLIKAAEIRSQIAQLESFDAAVGAFRTKYDCLPGDCMDAFAFDLIDNATRNGDGNDVIQSDGCIPRGRELSTFWVMLGKAGLIGGDYSMGNTPGINSPLPKMTGRGFGANARGGVWLNTHAYPEGAYGKLSMNSWYLSSVDNVTNGGIYPIVDALNLDSKIDDGLPKTGRVKGHIETLIALNMGDGSCVASQYMLEGESPIQCVDINQDNAYNISLMNPTSNVELCAVLIKASF